MKNSIPKTLIISIMLVMLLAACQSAEEGPVEAYWGYYEACENGAFESAELYLSEGAIEQKTTIGACGFTHDAINRYEVERGGTERTFSEEPSIEFDETSAVLTWIDDQGNLAIVQLINTGDGWKVVQTIWSD